jgi:hypothetical protein
MESSHSRATSNRGDVVRERRALITSVAFAYYSRFL